MCKQNGVRAMNVKYLDHSQMWIERERVSDKKRIHANEKFSHRIQAIYSQIPRLPSPLPPSSLVSSIERARF